MKPRSTLAAWAFTVIAFTASHSSAQTNDAPRYRRSDAPVGVFGLCPERWGGVGVVVVNPADREVDILSALQFGNNPDLQYGRRLWIPSKSVRSSWHPLLTPALENKADGKRGKSEPIDSSKRPMKLDISARLIDQSSGEVLLRDPHGAMIYAGMMPVLRETQATGLVADADDHVARPFVVLARGCARLAPSLSRLIDDSLPPAPECLQPLDHLVIASDRVGTDAAGCIAVRQWLHAGGHLWIMLDRVSPATVQLLLGEEFACDVLERITLTKWHFQGQAFSNWTDDLVATKEVLGGEVQTFEPPVDMVRVLVPSIKSALTIDGYPAAFSRPAGRGTVLFTTLGPRGWLKPRLDLPIPTVQGEKLAEQYLANQSLTDLSRQFFRAREAGSLKPQEFKAMIASQVGYQVIGRRPVLVILGVFCVGLLAAGLWLGKFGSLAHLGWIGPCTALAVALVLLILGYISRTSVPTTVAAAQFVEASPGSVDAPVAGLLGLYNREESSAPLGSTSGGVIVPDLQGQAGVTHRMVWTDEERWHWQNLTLSAGLHTAPFETSVRLEHPLSVHATFGPDGVCGRADLRALRDPSDAIIALPSRRNLAVRFGSADTFTAGPNDQLKPGQFVTANVFNEEQQHRQAIYQHLLSSRGIGASMLQTAYPSQPTFFTWAAPLDLGFTQEGNARRAGAALVAIPLQIDRPAPGTQLLIPAPFLPYRSLKEASITYHPRSNEWFASSDRPNSVMLRFQVPRELLPVRIDRAIMTVQMSAQGRKVDIVAPNADKVEKLSTHLSPVGQIQVEIDRSDLLQPDAHGGVYLGVSVGAMEKLLGHSQPATNWKLSDLYLELRGSIPD